MSNNPAALQDPSDSTPAVFKRRGLWWGGIFLAAVLCYLPSLSGDFIWNDSDYVTAPTLRGLRGLRLIWFRPGATQQYYPLLHSFFWIQFHVFGLNPIGYRITTLVLHAFAAVVFGLLVDHFALQTFRTGRSSLFSVGLASALIFAVHPINVESVAWITEQKNTLSLVFFLGTVWFYSRFDEARDPTCYGWALLCFASALLAKTVTATFPACILVLLWWQRGKLRWRSDFIPLAPFFVLGGTLAIFASWVERRYVGAQGSNFNVSLADRAIIAGHATFFYLGNLLWPAHLNFIYPRWKIDANNLSQWLFLIATLAIGGLCWLVRGRTRALFAAYALFLVSLFPVLGFVNLYGSRYASVWDHWQYLPDLAVIAFLVPGIMATARSVSLPWMFWCLITVVSVIFAAQSWSRCRNFTSDEILYRATVREDPTSWMAQNNLGRMLLDRGDLQEARTHLNLALAENPRYPEAHNNLAIYLLKTGSANEGIAELREALRLNQGMSEARTNLGLALAEMPGHAEEALIELRKVADEDPHGPRAADLHHAIGEQLAKTPGGLEEGIEEFRSAVALSPLNPAFRISLGIALFRFNRTEDSMAQFRAAIDIDPKDPRSHNDLGIALAKTGQTKAAFDEFREALLLDPNLVEAQRNIEIARQAGLQR